LSNDIITGSSFSARGIPQVCMPAWHCEASQHRNDARRLAAPGWTEQQQRAIGWRPFARDGGKLLV
jgi:hypothetical protein